MKLRERKKLLLQAILGVFRAAGLSVDSRPPTLEQRKVVNELLGKDPGAKVGNVHYLTLFPGMDIALSRYRRDILYLRYDGHEMRKLAMNIARTWEAFVSPAVKRHFSVQPLGVSREILEVTEEPERRGTGEPPAE